MKALACLLVLSVSGAVTTALAQADAPGERADNAGNTPTAKTSIQGQPLSPQTLAAALQTVNALLAEMKSGDNASGYDLLTPEAKQSETDDQWQAMVTQMKNLAGPRQHSAFAFGVQTDRLPQARPGDYVVIGLNSVFDKERLVETFILNEVEGRYMIAGYHFQSPASAAQAPSN